jgi:DNA sulfur modification protein DndD
MIIEKLTVHNLRSYAGEHTLEFALPGERNVTLIHGNNGAGKTSLFIILDWVLYGKQSRFDGSLIHRPVLESAGEGTGSALLQFTHNDVRYFLQRTTTAYRDPDGNINESYESPQLYTIDPSGNAKRERLVDEFIEQILPAPIRTFFFFDGDRIGDFTKPGKEQDQAITQAVNNLLKLDDIRRAIYHLRSVSKKLNAELKTKDVSPRIRQINIELEKLDRELEEKKARTQDLEQQIGHIRERKAKLDVKLMEFLEIREVAQRREVAEARRRELEKSISDLHQQLAQVVSRACYLPLVHNRFNDARQYLEEKRRKRQVPSNYRDQFLKDLLSQGKCICERPIQPGSPEEHHLRELLAATLPGKVQDRVQTLAARLDSLVREGDGKRRELNELLTSLHERVNERSEVNFEIKNLSQNIRDNIAEEIRQTEAQRDQLINEERELAITKAKTEEQIERLEKSRRDYQSELQSETAKVESLKGLGEQLRLTSEAEAAFTRIQSALEGGLKLDLSAEATRIFSSLIDKKDFFSQVSVGDHYLLRVLKESGEDVRPVMSMGETQILSLSFILAMISISEYQAPLLIDTPLARLDRSVRKNVVLNLPGLTNQLVLFVTDTEMTSDLHQQIRPKLGMEYRLEFQGDHTLVSRGC